ncbi:unnamed protein product [Ectocarpus sp. 12 AP-2014]
MAIANSVQDDPGSGLSPTDFRARCAEEGGSSSVEMGQENVIALLLQQQQEVLREVRGQRKGLALSQENKQEIARLVLSSLKKQSLHRQETATTGLPGPPTLAFSKRTSKKRASTRRRRKHSRSRREKHRKRERSRDGSPPGSYEPSPSSDHNGTGGIAPTGTSRLLHFPRHGDTTSAYDDRSNGVFSTSTTTVIRQRVEKPAEQVEVSLDGLWLPSLIPSSGVGSTGTAAGRRGSGLHDRATTAAVTAGQRVEESLAVGHPTAVWLASPLSRPMNTQNTAVVGGSKGSVTARSIRSIRARPATTVASQAARRRVVPGHPNHEGGAVQARSRLCSSRRRFDGDAADDDCVRGDRGAIQVVGDNDEYGCEDEENDGGDAPPLLGRVVAGEGCRDRHEEGGDATVPRNISRDTATMLERSRTLVARAKAYCGQTGRFSATDNTVGTEGDGGPHEKTSKSSCHLGPPPGAGGAEAPGTANGDDGDGGGRGEAGSILYGPSSPWPTAAGAFEDCDRCGGGAAGDGCDAESTAGEETGAKEKSLEAADGGHQSVGGYQVETSQRARRDSGNAPHPGILTTEIGARSHGIAAVEIEASCPEVPQQPKVSLPSPVNSEVGSGGSRGRMRGSIVGGSCSSSGSGIRSKGKKSKRRGQGVSGGGGRTGGDGDDGNPAKIDTEWENEIAKNILSLYQTKLKADLDGKKNAKEEDLLRKQRGYLTVEEEKDYALEQQHQQRQRRRFSHRAATAAPGPATSQWSNTEGCCGAPTKPGTAAASPVNTTPTPGRERATDHPARTSPSPSRRPVTRAANPREVVVSKDSSLGLHPPPIPAATAGTPGAKDGASGGGSHATGAAKAVDGGRGGFRGSNAISVLTRGGGEAVVMVPKRPRPIWFAGSGAIQAEWSALPGGVRVVRDLEGLEEQGRYAKYVAVVEGLLTAHLRADDQRGPSQLVKKLWRQLVATCIAFGVRSTENRRFERALELLKRAGILLSRQVLDKHSTLELRAFVNDAYGLYFLRRGKSSAALDYLQKAMKTHARMLDWGHVAKCHLHSSMVLSKLNRHDEALRCLGQVLAMVQEGKLDLGGNSPQKLCLVAICYHNMAVEQLILRHAGEACMSSQNARRLARLCLSYSNRWLHSFEGTHKLALAELSRSLSTTSTAAAAGADGAGGNVAQRRGSGRCREGEREQQDILQRLTEELFS